MRAPAHCWGACVRGTLERGSRHASRHASCAAASTITDSTLAVGRCRCHAQYTDAGKAHRFDLLSPNLAPEQRALHSGLALALATTEANARVTLHRFRRRFGSALRAEVASTVEDPNDPEQVESELQFLLATLAG